MPSASGAPETKAVFSTLTSQPEPPPAQSLQRARRTFRDCLALAGFADTGISLRWYRRNARGMGEDAAALFLGHILADGGGYSEQDQTIDSAPTVSRRGVEPAPWSGAGHR